MAPTWQENTSMQMAVLHQRSAFLSGSSNHGKRPEMSRRLAQGTHCQAMIPGLGLYLRQADSHPITTSSFKMIATPPVSASLHANIIPLASSFPSATPNLYLPRQKDPSGVSLARIIPGVLFGIIMAFGIIFVAQSSWNWKGRAPFKGLRCCPRRKSASTGEGSVLGKGRSFVGVDCENPTSGTTTHTRMKDLEYSEESNNPYYSVRNPYAMNHLFYCAPSNLSTFVEQGADIPPEPLVVQVEWKRDDFHGRLQVEEKDIALRDLPYPSYMDDAPMNQSLISIWNSKEDLLNDVLLKDDTVREVENRHFTLELDNPSKQSSDASTTSRESTATDVTERFSSSRSSITSFASAETDPDQEGPEIPYEVKRAQTQSVGITQGVLVAWQCTNAVMTATIPDIAPLAALVTPSMDNARGDFGAPLECHCSPTRPLRVRWGYGWEGTKDSLSRSLSDSACLHPVPYLSVTRPSTSTIFTFNSISSSVSVDLSDFPLPP